MRMSLSIFALMLACCTARASFVIPNNSITPPKMHSSNIQGMGINNCSIAASVGSSALTVSLKTASGSTPSALSPCIITFRNSTLGTGTVSGVSAIAATSVVVSNGSSLGCTVSVPCYVYVYAINNSGTVELGVISKTDLDEGLVYTSTAEGGAGAADTVSTFYSTTARTSKAVRLLGLVVVTPAASWAWSNNPASVANVPFQHSNKVYVSYSMGSGQNLNAIVQFDTKLYDNCFPTACVTTGAAWKFTAPRDGKYLVTYDVQCSGSTTNNIYKNGSSFSSLIDTVGSVHVGGAQVYSLDQGDYIHMQGGSCTLTAGSTKIQVSEL